MSVKAMEKDIEEIKGFLSALEEDFDNAIRKMGNQELNNMSQDLKLTSIEAVQKNTVTFNVNGSLINVNKDLFSSRDNFYPNILYELMTKFENNLQDLTKHYIQIDSQNFQICLDLLRKKQEQQICLFRELDTIEYMLPKNTNVDIFQANLESFFLGNVSKILKNLNIKYYEKSGVIKKFCIKNNLTGQIVVGEVSKVFQDSSLEKYLASSIEEILRPESKVAYFIGKREKLIISFRGEVSICEIEVKPFNLDKRVWYPADGAGSSVIVKEKGKDIVIGKIPHDFGIDDEKVYKIKLERPRMVSSITIEAGLFGCSISYFNLK